MMVLWAIVGIFLTSVANYLIFFCDDDDTVFERIQ